MSPDLPSPAPEPAAPARVRWCSPERGIDWHDAAVAAVAVRDPEEVGSAVAEALRAQEAVPVTLRCVVGALPFDTRSGHPLILASPDHPLSPVRPAPPTHPAPATGESAGVPLGRDHTDRSGAPRDGHPGRTVEVCTGETRPTARALGSTPDAPSYLAGVRRIREVIAAGGAQKVVLARRFEHVLHGPVDLDAVLDALGRRHPAAMRFRMPVPGSGVLLGASPELLLAKRGGCVRSHPLAGSAPRSADLRVDEENSAALLRSGKDRREHSFVIEAVADVLTPYCRRLVVPREPSLVGTRTTWHLGTWIEGELRDPETPSALLAAALHPTPAVCGTPTAVARDLLRALEPDRGYYAGTIGWSDAAGDGQWAVTIRSAVVHDDRLTAHAGAGIVVEHLVDIRGQRRGDGRPGGR